jgi:nickel superoxide dismutase
LESKEMKTFKQKMGVLALCLLTGGGILAISVTAAWAHCQIPCGIYGDQMRFDMLAEDITTIEKSMNQIIELSSDPGKNANQLIRWVTNKDYHGDKFADTILEYFLQQRISPADAKDKAAWDSYTHKLVLCHQMLVEAMKAKQTTDLDHVANLRNLLDDFHDAYFTEEEHEHLKEHHKDS